MTLKMSPPLRTVLHGVRCTVSSCKEVSCWCMNGFEVPILKIQYVLLPEASSILSFCSEIGITLMLFSSPPLVHILLLLALFLFLFVVIGLLFCNNTNKNNASYKHQWGATQIYLVKISHAFVIAKLFGNALAQLIKSVLDSLYYQTLDREETALAVSHGVQLSQSEAFTVRCKLLALTWFNFNFFFEKQMFPLFFKHRHLSGNMSTA